MPRPGETMRTIAITPSLSGLRGLIPDRDWQQVIEASVAVWNQALERCCSVRFSVSPAVNLRLATQDDVNVIVLRQGLWCHNEMCGHTSTFPIDTLAMTTAYPDGATGAQVREADVEVNPRMLHAVASDSLSKSPTLLARATESGIWVFGPPGTSYPVTLEAVVVHELGHVLGLGDTCVSDHRFGGMPVIGDCSTEQRDRVMFPDAHQLQPTAVDLADLAQLYPMPDHGLGMAGMWMLLSLGAALMLSVLLWRKWRT
jgi:hypothetical protein